MQTLAEPMPFNQSGYPMELLAGTTLNSTEMFALHYGAGGFSVRSSASYAINDHLTISLKGLNLTDEANDQFIYTTTNRLVV